MMWILPKEVLAQSAKNTENRRAKMVSVENGKKAPLGKFIDNKGQEFDFGNFRGKLIVVDFWASWCGPCIQQTPYYEELAEKFKDDNVIFLKISIDNKQDYWNNFILKRNWEKNSFWIGTDEENPIYPFVYSEYDDKSFKGIVTAVPRYVIISKEGNILDNQAWHPSHPKLQRSIKYYLRR